MTDRVVEVQKRVGHRLVRLDSGESLRVPTALFREFKLQTGDEIDVAAYRMKLSAAEARPALEAAVRMLELRDRSAQEIGKKLTDAGYSQQVTAQVLARLQEAGYQDDARTARQLVARLGKKYGAIRLRQELRRIGIAEELMLEVLDEQPDDSQLDSAIALARKSIRSRETDPQAIYRRAYGALARRGYPPSIVHAALKAALAEAEIEPEDFID